MGAVVVLLLFVMLRLLIVIKLPYDDVNEDDNSEASSSSSFGCIATSISDSAEDVWSISPLVISIFVGTEGLVLLLLVLLLLFEEEEGVAAVVVCNDDSGSDDWDDTSVLEFAEERITPVLEMLTRTFAFVFCSS